MGKKNVNNRYKRNCMLTPFIDYIFDNIATVDHQFVTKPTINS